MTPDSYIRSKNACRSSSVRVPFLISLSAYPSITAPSSARCPSGIENKLVTVQRRSFLAISGRLSATGLVSFFLFWDGFFFSSGLRSSSIPSVSSTEYLKSLLLVGFVLSAFSNATYTVASSYFPLAIYPSYTNNSLAASMTILSPAPEFAISARRSASLSLYSWIVFTASLRERSYQAFDGYPIPPMGSKFNITSSPDGSTVFRSCRTCAFVIVRSSKLSGLVMFKYPRRTCPVSLPYPSAIERLSVK